MGSGKRRRRAAEQGVGGGGPGWVGGGGGVAVAAHTPSTPQCGMSLVAACTPLYALVAPRAPQVSLGAEEIDLLHLPSDQVQQQMKLIFLQFFRDWLDLFSIQRFRMQCGAESYKVDRFQQIANL